MGCYLLTPDQFAARLAEGYIYKSGPFSSVEACEAVCLGSGTGTNQLFACTGPSGLPASKVLLWESNQQPATSLATLSAVKAVYASIGVIADTQATWSGVLADYGLIIWPIAYSDPSWWGLISGAAWTGRIHLTSEWQTAYAASRTYINSKSYLHGMTVGNDRSADGGCYAGHATAASHPLAAEMTELVHAASASVSGGSTVFTAVSPGFPMMQSNVNAGIDWVICGDSNHISDFCPNAPARNSQFLCNLWRNAVP